MGGFKSHPGLKSEESVLLAQHHRQDSVAIRTERITPILKLLIVVIYFPEYFLSLKDKRAKIMLSVRIVIFSKSTEAFYSSGKLDKIHNPITYTTCVEHVKTHPSESVVYLCYITNLSFHETLLVFLRGLSASLSRRRRDATESVKVETCTTLMLLVHPYNEKTEEGSYTCRYTGITTPCLIIVFML